MERVWGKWKGEKRNTKERKSGNKDVVNKEGKTGWREDREWEAKESHYHVRVKIPVKNVIFAHLEYNNTFH